MRNFKKTQLSIDDAYKSARRGLNDPKRQFMVDQEQTLKQAYANYDILASTGKLKDLQPLWSDADEKTYTFEKKNTTVHETHKHRLLAYNLYGSNRPIINRLWEELELLNSSEPGKRQELICPVCGLRKCNQMDHHAPRAKDVFPEYSVHLSNLIPLCDDCNEPKKSYWLDVDNGTGYRIWFNAYYDQLPRFEIFEPSIIIKGGYPAISISLSSKLDRTIEVHDVIYRTVDKLKLIERYQEIIQTTLTSFIDEKLTYYKYEKARYKDAIDYWGTVKNTIGIIFSKNDKSRIDEYLFQLAILNSQIFEEWLLIELNKLE